ncbi:MAG: hypothetical protein AAB639_00670, partial [Patescibacteria group bacterium]
DVYPGNVGTDYISSSPDWIPNLTPNYIQKLPVEAKSASFYLYKVVGLSKKDFELWAQLDKTNDQEAIGQPNSTCNLTPPSAVYNYCLQSPK